MKRAALPALLVASFTACRFLVDTEGLQGGVETQDAALQPVFTVDSAPTPMMEASTSSDAQADVKMEAAPLPFCQTRPGILFCTDFDVAGHNDGDVVGTDGTFAIETAQFVSAPKAALFTIVAGNAKEYKQVRRLVALPKNALKEITLEFALRPESKPEATTGVGLTYLIMKNGTQETGFIWEYNSVGLHAVSYNKPDTSGMNDTYFPKDFAADVNQWHTVRVVLTFGNAANGGAGGKYVATVDGTSLTQDFPTLVNLGDALIYGGGAYRDDAAFAQTKVRFDNIALAVSQ
jgi:hypothetical protein